MGKSCDGGCSNWHGTVFIDCMTCPFPTYRDTEESNPLYNCIHKGKRDEVFIVNITKNPCCEGYEGDEIYIGMNAKRAKKLSAWSGEYKGSKNVPLKYNERFYESSCRYEENPA
jgi:hypothetical protein